MIGVIAKPSERSIVSEFFELFKTPWEFYSEGQRYDVVICACDTPIQTTARLVLIYAGCRTPLDSRDAVCQSPRQKTARLLGYQGWRIPIYGDSVTFPQSSNELLVDQETGCAALDLELHPAQMRVRLGYDLFTEVRALLTAGQPVEYAGTATLELHIAILRDLMVASGAPFAEILPSPDGYSSIACLTHDVDHPSIRHHRFDHTMWGFLYRATLASWRDFFKGKTSVRDLLRNFGAALKLPFVHLGLAKDFWSKFQEYPKLENGGPSTFFVIPFSDCPGKGREGQAPRNRAAAYGAAGIAAEIETLTAAGCEIGLHGIDAWCDSTSGRREIQEIRRFTGSEELGVRMHWLYLDEQSFSRLERAGATYDSTVGYNDAVGFRTGTTQAYRPLEADSLLEMPLHVMDTALFYRGRLDLSRRQAREQVDNIIRQVQLFGGSVTLNWHDRSIAPERNWGGFYSELIDELKGRKAWFATAAQAVGWFRKRRSAVIETLTWESDVLHVKATAKGRDTAMPGLCIRIHRPRELGGTTAPVANIDLSLDTTIDFHMAIGTSKEMTPSRESEPSPGSAAYAI